MVQVLFTLQSLFSLWMLYDALSKGRDRYWVWIVLIPFGEVLYFFKVKIHDPDMAWLKNAFRGIGRRPLGLSDLRAQAADSPSFANRLALAQALHDHKKYAEAKALFLDLLQQDNSDHGVLYGLGRCCLEVSDFEQAIESLEYLVELNPAYQDYDAWLLLAEVHEERGDSPAELGILEHLVRHTERIEHRIAFGEALLDAGQNERGHEQIERALRDHAHAPSHAKRRARGAVRRAKALV